MSQIPRRTNLSLTQPQKPRKTPTMVSTLTPSQPLAAKRMDGETPRAAPKTIELEAPIVIDENSGFGDLMDNDALIQVLNSVEERNGNGVAAAAAEEKPKESRRSKKEKKAATASQESSANGDESCSSVRTSVDSSVTSRTVDEVAAPLEMESLLIPDDDELLGGGRAEKSVAAVPANFDSPRPQKTPGGSTKVVRLTKGMRLSPFRKSNGGDQQQPLDDVSTIVNLSTVSELSVENQLDDSPVVDAAKNGGEEEAEAESGGGSRVRISARRTFATNRPLREMSFKNATREAYKKLGEGDEAAFAATANDSVNATVGSELGLRLDDLPETPAAVGQKRRRNQEEDGSDEEAEGEPAPKKGFLQTYCAIM